MSVDDRATLALVLAILACGAAAWSAWFWVMWDRFQARRFWRRAAKRGVRRP